MNSAHREASIHPIRGTDLTTVVVLLIVTALPVMFGLTRVPPVGLPRAARLGLMRGKRGAMLKLGERMMLCA